MSSGNGALQKDSLAYNSFYRGEVVSTADTQQLGRVKIRVFGVFGDAIPIADLPWAVPAQSVFTGSGSGYGPGSGAGVFCTPDRSQLFGSNWRDICNETDVRNGSWSTCLQFYPGKCSIRFVRL